MQSSEDYSVIAQTMQKEFKVSEQRANQLIAAFLQWFSLVPFLGPQDGPLQMTQSVDMAWHAMIINTAFYRRFCDQYIGYYVDHDPLDMLNQTAAKQDFAEKTFKRLQIAFGESLHPEWLNVAEVTCCLISAKAA
jgi:hypothetical protein